MSKKNKTVSKKRVSVNKLITQKTKIKVVSDDPILIKNDLARIKRNESSKLNRINKKLSGNLKRGERSKLKTDYNLQKDIVDRLNKEVVKTKKIVDKAQNYIDEIKELTKKDRKLTLKLKKQKKHQNTDEYKKITKDAIKNNSIIKEKKNNIGELLFKLNKKLGISSEDIIDGLEMSDSFIKKKLSKQIDENYFLKKEQKKELHIEELNKEELLDDAEYIEEMATVFWEVWRDFDKFESNRLLNYDTVTFVIDDIPYVYKGSSLSFIHMKASDMWRVAMEQGSNTYIVKYISIDSTKLKYIIE